MVITKAKGRKTRSAGRFGTRYGVKNRKLVADIEEKMHADYACSKCGAVKVKRIASGIWKCTKCEASFTGGSYIPQTPAHMTVLRSVQSEKAEITIAGGSLPAKK
jgi:large subunit ribosomal protein L37Ae